MNYRKNLSGTAAYKSAIPISLFDVAIECDEHLDRLIADAEQALRQWNERVMDVGIEAQDALMHREAEVSWMLSEGETMDLFAPLGVPPVHSNVDDDDIKNLEHAIRWSARAVEELPIGRRLLSDAHYIMCQSERYARKYPGDFRTSPVWLGKAGSTLQDAGVFVPPVDDDMIAAFTDLERFIHYADGVHPLVRVAMAHYQFETIHPFIDGNGRIGRLLAQLMLMYYGYIDQPQLQLSEQLSRHSINYYYMIQQTHLTANYREWVRFFVLCVKKACNAGLNHCQQG